MTFNKAAVNDGDRRLQEAIAQAKVDGTLRYNVRVNARTLHACAQRAFSDHVRDDLPARRPDRLWTEKAIQDWIAETCSDAIDYFCRHCFLEIEQVDNWDVFKNRGAEERAREQATFFIYKTLRQFCKGDLSRVELGTHKKRHYYPAKLFHEEGKMLFPPKLYSGQFGRLGFYADQACRVWDLVVKKNIRTHDFQIKRVQLMR